MIILINFVSVLLGVTIGILLAGLWYHNTNTITGALSGLVLLTIVRIVLGATAGE
jgi:hypothetical protein